MDNNLLKYLLIDQVEGECEELGVLVDALENIHSYEREVEEWTKRKECGGAYYYGEDGPFFPWEEWICDDNGTRTFKTHEQFLNTCDEVIQRSLKKKTEYQNAVNRIWSNYLEWKKDKSDYKDRVLEEEIKVAATWYEENPDAEISEIYKMIE